MERHIAVLMLIGSTAWAEPPIYPDKANLLIWKDAQGNSHPVRTAADLVKRRAHIVGNMEIVMGPLPDAAKKVPLDAKQSEEQDMGAYTCAS